MFVKIFVFNPFQENTYVVYNNNGNAFIIDPGCYTNDEQEMLKNFIVDNKLKPTKLLNTHCHLDHVFGNKFIAETFGMELYMHKNDEIVLERAPIVAPQFGMPPFENYVGKINFLQDKEEIFLDDDKFEVLFTPGHSPGSISFYNEQKQMVIVGDVLFYEGIGRTDLPGGNFEVLASSIKEKLYNLPNETKVYNGHGQPTTIGHEKIYNPYVRS